MSYFLDMTVECSRYRLLSCVGTFKSGRLYCEAFLLLNAFIYYSMQNIDLVTADV